MNLRSMFYYTWHTFWNIVQERMRFLLNNTKIPHRWVLRAVILQTPFDKILRCRLILNASKGWRISIKTVCRRDGERVELKRDLWSSWDHPRSDTCWVRCSGIKPLGKHCPPGPWGVETSSEKLAVIHGRKLHEDDAGTIDCSGKLERLSN